MPASQSLAPRPPATLETVHNILGSLVARHGKEEVLTAVRQIPARVAKFRPMPAWVTSALAEAYRCKGILDLYSHQASTAELVRKFGGVVESQLMASRHVDLLIPEEFHSSPVGPRKPMSAFLRHIEREHPTAVFKPEKTRIFWKK